MEYIMGIDASTTNTGISVFRSLKSGDRYYKHHLISFEGKKVSSYRKAKMTKVQKAEIRHKEANERVDYMIIHIISYLDKYRPSVIVIEDIYAKTDINTMKLLGRIQGAVLGYALTHNVQLLFKAPSKWRSEVGLQIQEGKDKAKRENLKEQSKNMVKELYGVTVTDDEADSILIALSYIRTKHSSLVEGVPTSSYKEVLEK